MCCYLTNFDERHSGIGSADSISAQSAVIAGNHGSNASAAVTVVGNQSFTASVGAVVVVTDSLARRILVTGGIAFQDAAHSGMRFPPH